MKVIDLLRVMPRWDKVRIVPSDGNKWELDVNYIMLSEVWQLPWSLVSICGDCDVTSVEVYESDEGAYVKIEYEL